MRRSPFQRILITGAAGALANLPGIAFACSACMGDPNSKSAGAINAAIFLMIGCIGAMLASLGGFAFYLFKRASAPLPPHVELGESINETDD
ncbi:MAG: hypothetical protein QOE70_3544 [Chthoniobacter sp.]|jgi:hypothetical protein|nr:hypothetical protein [Chthoniobacter sp.]